MNKDQIAEYIAQMSATGFFVAPNIIVNGVVHSDETPNEHVVTALNTYVFFKQNENKPWLVGNFVTKLTVVTDNQEIEDVAENCYYNPESIKITKFDDAFAQLAISTNHSHADLFFEILNRLKHQENGHTLNILNEKNEPEPFTWGDYASTLPITNNDIFPKFNNSCGGIPARQN